MAQGRRAIMTEDRLRSMEKKLAMDYYVNMQYHPKDIADLLGVDIRTVQKWASDEGWKELKVGMIGLPSMQMQIVINLTQRMLEETQKPVGEMRYDFVAKLNKAIKDLEFVNVDAMMMQTICKDFILYLYESKKQRLINMSIVLLEGFMIWRKEFKK